ncbi:di-heme-cytochrome C peroxidase [Pseudomonadota bacterium]|nr:di-heme-cytochrome C peroxidase [Pseudomonadota bacterium]
MLVLSLVSISTGYAADSEKVRYLEQNWSDEERNYFYFSDQGSRLIPYNFFLHLEQAENEELFRSDNSMLRLGFIPAAPSANNPDGLPIGLARNGDKMGPTCAACHTQQIRYKNQNIRIDGGQAFVDFQLFLKQLTASLKATVDDKKKFLRFQQKLLGDTSTKKQQQALQQQLLAEYEKRSDYSIQSHTESTYGYTRLDAFGAILNKALIATGVDNNTSPPNAPTSYPYIWDTPQHDYVEWNGSQSNSAVGALARNIGEVIGVFGDIETETSHWLGFIDGGYDSSINTSELRELESIVGKLHSPLWPDSFPEIDNDLAKVGRGLYEQHCIQCHVDIDRTDPMRTIQVRMSTLSEIKTDPLMAENAINTTGKTGKFEGRPRYYFAGDALAEEAPAIHIANNIMIGILKNNPLQSTLAKRDSTNLGHPDVNHPPKYVDGEIIEHGKEVSDHALLAYKARPLNGVWTSAPYLHNGSVPDMYQLLLPEEQRVKQFYLGSWEYDVKNLGYVSQATDTRFLFDTTLIGNSNAGHEYGTGYYGNQSLTEQERWALIEYLKTL